MTLPLYLCGLIFSSMGHCYRRLKAFSKEFGDLIGGKFCSIDLDVVINRRFNGSQSTTRLILPIMKDFQPPQPYNGSFFIMEPGARYGSNSLKTLPQGLIAKGNKLGLLCLRPKEKNNRNSIR